MLYSNNIIKQSQQYSSIDASPLSVDYHRWYQSVPYGNKYQ